ncbi:beta-ketoacyl-[acyl-carrier-protein] synthase family protein [Rossellomorea sp. LjRoot5]|uniref:beta-ketoacyl-[acyl-carrier-protein] synthase family protein n=1 Tax=Rossellomorea sp. LjRoot5 TaxID=3342331 RepID=UPI003ECF2291
MSVVITGLGQVSSLGSNIEELWSNILVGNRGISRLKNIDTSGFSTLNGAQIEIEKIKQVIPLSKMFEKSIQISLVAMDEAIKSSELIIEKDDLSTGIVIGTSLGGNESFFKWKDRLEGKDINQKELLPLEVLWNNVSKFLARRYNISGPNSTMVTACAASANSLAYGYNLIETGKCKRVICGGFDLLSRTSFLGFSALKSLAKDYCRPFDKNRSGISIGEAAAFLVLEAEESAIERGAKNMVRFSGYGIGNDAYHATSPDPSGVTAQFVMEEAVKKSKKSLKSVDYINAHGTGTLLNDKMETLAIKNLFGSDAYSIPVSSTKSMHGHTLGAAGALEAIITILAIKNNVIPPTIGYEHQDSECDLFYCPNEALSKNVDFAISNSFAFGGHSVSLAFEKMGDV